MTASSQSTFDLSVVPRDVFTIVDRLRKAGRYGWIVGGCVRDSLLGEVAHDWDVATEARPDELMRIFPRAIPTGLQHGTVTLVMGGEHYEVTTLRGEAGYSDGRHPDAVHFVEEIEADLARRDFTINAIAVDPHTGALVDPFGGRADLDAKVIRAVGSPLERFSEDGLRVLRAARFAATLEFDLDRETFDAITPTLDTFRKVSAERVREEWMKTMRARRPSRAFEVMKDTGILGVTCPELLEGVGMEQNKWHEFDVWRHGLACMDACAGDAVLRVAALLHDVGKPRTREFNDKKQDYTFYQHEIVGAKMADEICARLKFSTDDRQRIVALVRHHMIFYDDGWSDAAVRRWIRRVGKERVADLYVLNEADIRAKGESVDPVFLEPLAALEAHVEKVLAEGAALSTRDLEINGRVLMKELGLAPGPIIGRILDALLEEVLTDPAMNRSDVLLDKARALAAESS